MSQGQDAQDKIRELEERVRAQQKELGRLRQVEIQVDYFKGQFERVKRDRAELEKLYDDHIAKCAGIVIKEDFPSYTPQNFRNVEPPHTHAPTRNVEPLIVPATSSSVQSSLNQLTAHPNHSPAVSHAKPPSKANHIVETHVMTGVHAPYPSPMNEPDMHTSAQTIKLDTENSTASSLRIKRETLSRTVPDPEPKLGDTSSTVPTLIDLTKTEVTNSPMPTQSNSSAPDVAKANIPTASSDGTDTVGRASSNGATTPPAKKAKLVSLPTPPPLPPVLPAKTDPPTFITNPIPDAHVNVIDRTLAGAIAPVNTAASADVSATSSATTSNELARKCYPPLEATAKTPQHNILAGVAKPAAASHGIPHVSTGTTSTTMPRSVSADSGVNLNPSPTMVASTASPQLHATTGLVKIPTPIDLQNTRSTILSRLDKAGQLEKEQNKKPPPNPFLSVLRDDVHGLASRPTCPVNFASPLKKRPRKVKSAEITSDNSGNLKKLIPPEKDTLAGAANKMAPVSTARSVLPPTKSMLASRDRKTVGEDLRNARVANIREQKIAVDADHCTKRAFSRAFISHLFGGSPQETFSRPRQDLIDRHGYDGFMCLNTSYNPNAPGERGAAGLFFSLGAPRETPRKHEKVFLRTGANLWMYLGDYEMVRTEPLSSFEYRSLNQNVTNTWTSKAMDKGWALHIRASIRLRRNLRREPTTEELKAFVDKAGQNSNLAAVEIHEIKDAFRTGKEKICVWTMRCLKYDHTFQRKLAEEFDALSSLDQEKFSATQSSKSTGKRKQTAPNKKSSVSSDEETDERSSNLSDSDSDVVLLDSDEYMPRGTRSRPSKRLKT